MIIDIIILESCVWFLDDYLLDVNFGGSSCFLSTPRAPSKSGPYEHPTLRWIILCSVLTRLNLMVFFFYSVGRSNALTQFVHTSLTNHETNLKTIDTHDGTFWSVGVPAYESMSPGRDSFRSPYSHLEFTHGFAWHISWVDFKRLQ